jgi:hypothetical protein
MSEVWSSPLRQKKVKPEKPPPTRDELQAIIRKALVKPKCVIPASQAKKILNATLVDQPVCEWVERWIDDFIRGNCYPPQLKSADFYSLLPTYFAEAKVLEVLTKIRGDFGNAFPLLNRREADDDLAWLPPLLKSDVLAVSFLPPQYLN